MRRRFAMRCCRHLGKTGWERWYQPLVWGLLIAVILLLLNAFQLKAVPTLRLAARTQGNNLAAEMVSVQVAESLQEYGGEFVQVERDEDGRILSVGMDVQKANLLKADLTLRLTEQVTELPKRKLSIPLGTILGGALLNGRGPRIEFIVEPYGSTQVNFIQNIQSAGINQTVYQVQMKVKLELNTTLAGVSQPAGCETTFLLEERLIAGEVPQLYAQGGFAEQKKADEEN